MIKSIIIFLMLCSLAAICGDEIPKRIYPCRFVDKSTDGKSDENIWDKLEAASSFFILREDSTASEGTSFKAFYTNDSLHIRVICPEPDMENVRATMKDGDKLWEEDDVELFISWNTEADGKYYQFISSMNGARYNAYKKEKKDILNWSCRAAREKDRIIIDMTIPFKTVWKKPAAGAVWAVNICRNDRLSKEGRISSWAFIPPGADLHSKQFFCQFVFDEAGTMKYDNDTGRILGKYYDMCFEDSYKRIQNNLDYNLNLAAPSPEIRQKIADECRIRMENIRNSYQAASSPADRKTQLQKLEDLDRDFKNIFRKILLGRIMAV